MRVNLFLAAVHDPNTLSCACGVVVVDEHSARPVLEAGHHLGQDIDGSAASYAALARALDELTALSVDSVSICSNDDGLIAGLSGSDGVPDEATPWFERLMPALLGLATWGVVRGEGDPIHRASDLAQQAMEAQGGVRGLTPDAVAAQRETETGIPQWTAMLTEDPQGRCPAQCQAGVRYAFGPNTPAGLCVHAAKVVLNDGPMVWSDTGTQKMTSLCERCGVGIELTRLG